MERQTSLPTKYELGDHFVAQMMKKYNPDKKYRLDECPYVDTIYDRGDGIPLYVLYIKSDPEYEATVAESVIDELYVMLTDDMLDARTDA